MVNKVPISLSTSIWLVEDDAAVVARLVMRFDDTNPMNEKIEFVDNIIRDLKTLNITPDQITYSSDHFEMLQNYMKQLIQEGKAYADNLPAEEMKN